jgi:hypothetical protein
VRNHPQVHISTTTLKLSFSLQEWSAAISKYEWITPAHLDIQPQQINSNLWDQAKAGISILF